METASLYTESAWCDTFKDCESHDQNDSESESTLKKEAGILIKERSTKVVKMCNVL